MSVKSDSPMPPGLMDLAEDHLLLLAVQRPPGADAPLQRAADARVEIGMAAPHLVEDGHRPQPRCRLQQRHDLGIEDVGRADRAGGGRAAPACAEGSRGSCAIRYPVAVLNPALAAAMTTPSSCRNFMYNLI